MAKTQKSEFSQHSISMFSSLIFMLTICWVLPIVPMVIVWMLDLTPLVFALIWGTGVSLLSFSWCLIYTIKVKI